jgi:hypothetical protein
MRKIFCTVGLVALLSGCCPLIGPDQVRIQDYVFWKNADLVIQDMGGWDLIEVGPGKHTILRIDEGWSHGRRTSAHGSSDKIYFVLPQNIQNGAIFTCTPQAGTFAYSGFAFRRLWIIQPAKPARAVVQIITIKSKSVHADVDVAFTAIGEDEENPETAEGRKVVCHGKHVFRLR